MSEETEQEPQQSGGIVLPVDWHFPEDVQSRYANNVLVQNSQYEFIISFFEMQFPLLLGSPEENKVKLEDMESIRAECVSKIIIPHELMQGLINSLQTELEKYRSLKLDQ
jgi:Protein of unknown function (DUF3467)